MIKTILLASLLVMALVVTQQQQAKAQNTNINFTQLFKEKIHTTLPKLGFDKDYKSIIVNSSFSDSEVKVLYQSNKTVVLEGDKLTSFALGIKNAGYVDNPYIWQAVDLVKQQGYTIDSVVLSGQGSVGNPHKYAITLSHK